jgi:TPR repeat protein
MASSRLALYEQQAGPTGRVEIDDPMDQRYRALQDAKQVRILWSTWWKGHLRVGQVYAALNEQEKAINSFERALALEPAKSEIQKALNESRYTLGQQSRKEHLDPWLRPRSLPEQLNELQQKYGMNPEQVRNRYSLLAEIDPSVADIVKAYQYEHGDVDVKQDYEQAAKYYAKAASQGNAEGMANLARLTDRGLGVKKDHDMAQKLFEQASEQPPQNPKLKGVRNIGVSEAEHSLALRYANGIVVNKNLAAAAYWYQRAVDHGNIQSANNLGSMYRDGSGVDMNQDKAEELFELAARGGDPHGMLNLAFLLFHKTDFQMSKIWYDRACEAGHIIAQTDRDTFERMLQKKQQFKNGCSSGALQLMNTIINFTNSLKTSKTASSLDGRSYINNYHILIEHANRGSITARKMCDAMEHFAEALSILIQTNSLTENEEDKFVHELSQCYRIEHIVARIPGIEMGEKIVKLVDRVLHRCSTKSSTTVSQLDEDSRVCYTVLHMDSPELLVQFLSLCKKKYPKSTFFLKFCASMNASLQRYTDTLYDVNLGLEIDPNCSNLLYDKADALRLMENYIDEAIEAYRVFLAVAPKDHRHVPDAYYAMGNCYLMRRKPEDITDIVKTIYEKGEKEEKIQLPCFLPYESNHKKSLKYFLDFDVKSFLNVEPPAPIVNNKSRLTKQHRIEVIVEHRKWQSNFLQKRHTPSDATIFTTQTPLFKQQTVKSLIGLKPITLRELNPTKDHVYNEYVLFVTIIGEAYSWSPSIHIVVEDEHYDCTKICVYGFPEDQGKHLISKVFTIGSKMHIINPYLRLGKSDLKPIIRVDDFSSIIMQNESERVINMCRCCGEPNAPYVCSKCKQALYCTKECQTMDWKLYKHKLICKN